MSNIKVSKTSYHMINGRINNVLNKQNTNNVVIINSPNTSNSGLGLNIGHYPQTQSQAQVQVHGNSQALINNLNNLSSILCDNDKYKTISPRSPIKLNKPSAFRSSSANTNKNFTELTTNPQKSKSKSNSKSKIQVELDYFS